MSNSTLTSLSQAPVFCFGGDLGSTRAPQTSLGCLPSSLPISQLSPRLVKIQNSRPSQNDNQWFPANSRSPDFHRGAWLSLQIAQLRAKNRNTERHTYMQIGQPNSLLKIVIYYLACILAQKTLYTYFMLIYIL